MVRETHCYERKPQIHYSMFSSHTNAKNFQFDVNFQKELELCSEKKMTINLKQIKKILQ